MQVEEERVGRGTRGSEELEGLGGGGGVKDAESFTTTMPIVGIIVWGCSELRLRLHGYSALLMQYEMCARTYEHINIVR